MFGAALWVSFAEPAMACRMVPSHGSTVPPDVVLPDGPQWPCEQPAHLESETTLEPVPVSVRREDG